jgi:hypothetical protein
VRASGSDSVFGTCDGSSPALPAVLRRKVTSSASRTIDLLPLPHLKRRSQRLWLQWWFGATALIYLSTGHTRIMTFGGACGGGIPVKERPRTLTSRSTCQRLLWLVKVLDGVDAWNSGEHKSSTTKTFHSNQKQLMCALHAAPRCTGPCKGVC